MQTTYRTFFFLLRNILPVIAISSLHTIPKSCISVGSPMVTLCQILSVFPISALPYSFSYFNTKALPSPDIIRNPAGKRAKIIRIIVGVFIDLSPMPTRPEWTFSNEPCDRKRDRAKSLG